MSLPAGLAGLIGDNRDGVIALLLLTNIILLIGYLWTLSRVGKLTRLYRRLTKGTSGGNLEEILQEYMETVKSTDMRMTALEARANQMAETLLGCTQRTAVVRYNAFDEVGGDQSFAIAMIDAKDNGIVMSSVYSRSDVRVYAKGVQAGQPNHPLTNEEAQALKLAQGKR